jgi:UDP-N-acetyl-D-mannosaminuronic acid dehydrogenase
LQIQTAPMQSSRINGRLFSDIIPNSDHVAEENSSEAPNGNFGISRVLIVGLGQLGLPIAKYVKERGFDTYGYDIEQKAVERAEKVASIKQADSFSDFDVYIICVSTHKPGDIFVPQIEGLLRVVEEISRKAKNGAIVSIESTIPRGTSKRVFELLNHRLHVVHVPHRWYALEEAEHGVNQLRVIGGVHDCCLRSALQFYTGGCISGINTSSGDSITGNGSRNINRNLGIPLHPVSNIEIAEITKVAENAHRYLQIAFAEDLYLYCTVNNLSFPELREAINTKWNVNILEPRDGIGGHCLPKDTRMFLQSSKSVKSKILTAALEVDQDYRRHRQSRVELEVLCKEMVK